MTSLGLRVDGEVTAPLAAAIGTVPALYSGPTDGAPEVAWIVADRGWADRAEAALRQGAAAVVVDTPPGVTPDEIDRLAGRPVVLAATRTQAPQVGTLARLIAAQADPPDWVDVLVVDGSPTRGEPSAALWDAAAMLTAAGIGIDTVPRVSVGPAVVLADTTAGPARVHLSCVHQPGAAPAATIRVFAAGGSVAATMGDPAVAVPGEVVAVGAQGATVATTDYQTPRRVALTGVHAALTTGVDPLPGRLDDYAGLSRLLGQVMWPPVLPESQPQEG